MPLAGVDSGSANGVIADRNGRTVSLDGSTGIADTGSALMGELATTACEEQDRRRLARQVPQGPPPYLGEFAWMA